MKQIQFNETNLTPLHSSLEIIENIARVSKIEKLDQDDSNTYVTIDGIAFYNGII